MMICYIVLHYNETQITINCVESIRKIKCVDERKIIIVDNGSKNNSFEVLNQKYFAHGDVVLLCNKVNLGFSQGNNIGYLYAKRNFNPDFMVMCNNDLLFEQSDFEVILFNEYEKNCFDVMGPDVVNLKGIHQNPSRLELLDLKKVRRINRNKRILIKALKIKRCLRILNGISFLEDLYDKRNIKKRKGFYKDEYMEDIVLIGACIIFTKKYIREQENAFEPLTFLYFEEELLSLRCREFSYKCVVCPKIKVKHLEGVSTKKSKKNILDSKIFALTESLKSGKIYEKVYMNYIKDKKIEF